MKRAIQILFLLVTLEIARSAKLAKITSIIIEDGYYDCAEENSNRSPNKSLKGWKPTPFEDVGKIAIKCFSPSIVKFLNCFHRETYVVDAKGCFLIPRAIQQDYVFVMNQNKHNI